MRILGIDPGMRHTGYCLLITGRPGKHGVIDLAGRGKVPIQDAITAALTGVRGLVRDLQPDMAVVEQVAWYGRASRITLPLSHVAGAIVGYLLAQGIPVCLLQASQRVREIPKTWQKWTTEHERDAAALATALHRQQRASDAGGASTPRRPSAVVARIITIPPSAPGRP